MNNKPRIRLHVTAALTAGSEHRLNDERSHYVSRVLRLRVGDELTLFDGRGGEFYASITRISAKGVMLHVGDRSLRSVESPLKVDLLQGVSRGERMDVVVQKATELGVHCIVPLITRFSVVRLDAEKREKRVAHWRKVARSACEQCGRNIVPTIDLPVTLTGRLEDSVANDAQRVVLHPGAERPLASLPDVHERVELLIGPEGGLDDAELEQAVAAGFTVCSMGPRVLRTETAAIAALSLLQSRWGDLA